MESTGTLSIADLPLLDEIDAPDFGVSLDWINDDLYKRPYDGLYRTSWDAPVFFRNAEVREIAAMKEATHQTLDSMSAYWQEAAPDHCKGLLDTFGESTFSMRHPEHLPTKKLTSRRLTTGSVSRFESAAADAIRAQIDIVADGSEINFMNDFAKHVVARFWTEVLGLTPEEGERAVALITDFQLSSLMAPTPEQIAAASAGAAEYVAMMTAAINREIAGGRHDVLTELRVDFDSRDPLVHADDPGTALAVTLLDGFHTLAAVTANVMHALISAPGEHERVRADRSLLHEAYQEGTRMHTAPILSQREALRDFEYGGVPIAEGTPLLVMWFAGNRDPRVWDDPATYRLGREDRLKQTTFGGGAYVCAGKNVVRLVAETAIRELTEPTVLVEPTGDVEWVGGSSIHELHSMPVRVRRV